MCSIPARFSISLALLVSASAHAQSFLYQLQNINVTNAAASSYAWIVTDYSHDGSGAGELTSNEVATLKSAGTKTVLAYLSIGEAEDYRFYWNPSWLKSNRPAWLGPVNPSWRGNYEVKYWDPTWQAIVQSYLDRILAQDFDGAYLDIVDGYEFWESQRPSAAQDMINFVQQLAGYARAKHPGFLIIPQNASPLVTNAGYLATISAIGAEDTWFNGDKRQKPADTTEVTGYLDLVRAAGKPVLSIDYVRKQANIDRFYSVAEAKGYTPYATVRGLDQLVINLHHSPGTTNVPTVLGPADGAEVRPDTPPTFRWPKSGLQFWLNFAGDDAFTKVVTIPSASTSSTNYTPTATEWAAVTKLGGNRLWWWLTAQDGNQQLHSGPARRLYPLHTKISTTYFWIGEPSDADNHFIPNDASAWDDLWKQHFGGVDDPNARSTDPAHPYWPAFTPLENPFYCALPFNDFDRHGNRRDDIATIVPWAHGATYGPLESALKNHWVKILFAGKVCYAQWEDVGPFGESDSKYVFGTKPPKNKTNQHAGLDVSPAVKDYLGLTGLDPTDWCFVFPGETVPPGPWSEVITTNQITWLP
jgi:cysteinyl-tRNA synthetase